MGKLTDLKIVLDNDGNVFSPGDTIKGQVVLDVSDQKDRGLNKVKGIWVQYKGNALTKWTEETNIAIPIADFDVDLKTKSKAKEEYFDSTDVLFGAGEMDPVIKGLEIPPGTHSYPFEYELPAASLPAPFEGPYGFIKYNIEAIVSLERAIFNTEHKTEKRFSMLGPSVDLNVLPGMEVPVKKEEEVKGGCGCGSTVEMSISATMPKQGYVPGEPIYIEGKVDNKDKDETMVLKAKLLQKVTYRAQTDTKIKEYTMAKAVTEINCPKGRVSDYKCGPLLIPPVPPSGLPGCDIINITYQVEFRDHFCDILTKFAITIGTVPLRNHRPVKSDETKATEYPTEDAEIDAVDDDETPKISYKESDAKPPDIECKSNYFNQTTFLPSYWYYDFMVDPPPEPK